MKWFEDQIARLVRERGAAAAWQLASLAAIAPYIVLPVLASPLMGHPLAPSSLSAISLALTLVLLIALRTALNLLYAPGGSDCIPPSIISQDAKDTLAAKPARALASADDALWLAMESHDAHAGAAGLGIVRFANYPAMSAYSAIAACRVLSVFARKMDAAIGAKRLTARLDSHTFAIWFSGDGAPNAKDELISLAYVLAQEIEDPDITVGPDIHVGLAAFIEGETALAMMARAQALAIPLKRFAQGDLATSSSGAVVTPADRFAMEQALRCAVREGQLHLHYQPFVDVGTGRVAGAEALLRWRHPEFGDVSPSRFVPLLEETGLIHEIGLWTLNTACRQLGVWRSAAAPDLRLAINLSAIQLQNPSLRTVIERTVSAHGLSPRDLELELTETAAMEDHARTVTLFHELRELGFGIAIDDFGNGHSNLSYLKNLPFTKLKIDRDFVTHVDMRPGSLAICKAMIELADGLGIGVLAEGVERIEEVETLRRLGCNVFQGFYFARGMAADDLTTKLIDPDWLALIASTIHRQRAEITKRTTS